jgi:hypothetical protein
MNRRYDMTARTPTTRRNYLLSRFAIAGMASAAVVAGAAMTRAEAQEGLNAPPGAYLNTFTLSNSSSADVLKYYAPRELRICNSSGRPTADENRGQFPPSEFPLINKPVTMGATPVPLDVSYHGITHEIAPGECYRLEASRVRIALAQPLPPGSWLQGTAEWVMPAEVG